MQADRRSSRSQFAPDLFQMREEVAAIEAAGQRVAGRHLRQLLRSADESRRANFARGAACPAASLFLRSTFVMSSNVASAPRLFPSASRIGVAVHGERTVARARTSSSVIMTPRWTSPVLSERRHGKRRPVIVRPSFNPRSRTLRPCRSLGRFADVLCKGAVRQHDPFFRIDDHHAFRQRVERLPDSIGHDRRRDRDTAASACRYTRNSRNAADATNATAQVGPESRPSSDRFGFQEAHFERPPPLLAAENRHFRLRRFNVQFAPPVRVVRRRLDRGFAARRRDGGRPTARRDCGLEARRESLGAWRASLRCAAKQHCTATFSQTVFRDSWRCRSSSGKKFRA